MEKVKEYQLGDVTVFWRPESCIHSANCVKALPGVFKPKERPWIQVENTNEKNLIAAIKTCPSGALAYKIKNNKTMENTESTAAATTVNLIENGPVVVVGTVEVCHPDGTKEVRERRASFCRCGKTANGAFCDGSHNK